MTGQIFRALVQIAAERGGPDDAILITREDVGLLSSNASAPALNAYGRRIVCQSLLFLGGLDLRDETITCGIEFRGCEFQGDVILRRLQATDEKNKSVGALLMRDCLVQGSIDIRGAKLSGSFELHTSQISGSVRGGLHRPRRTDQYVRSEFGRVDLGGSQIGGNVSFGGSVVESQFRIEQVRVAGSVSLRVWCRPSERLNLEAHRTEIKGSVEAHGCRVDGDFTLRGAQILGRVVLTNARIGGMLVARPWFSHHREDPRLMRRNIAYDLRGWPTDIRGGLFGARITVEGAVDLSGAWIAGDVDFQYGQLGSILMRPCDGRLVFSQDELAGRKDDVSVGLPDRLVDFPQAPSEDAESSAHPVTSAMLLPFIGSKPGSRFVISEGCRAWILGTQLWRQIIMDRASGDASANFQTAVASLVPHPKNAETPDDKIKLREEFESVADAFKITSVESRWLDLFVPRNVTTESSGHSEPEEWNRYQLAVEPPIDSSSLTYSSPLLLLVSGEAAVEHDLWGDKGWQIKPAEAWLATVPSYCEAFTTLIRGSLRLRTARIHGDITLVGAFVGGGIDADELKLDGSLRVQGRPATAPVSEDGVENLDDHIIPSYIGASAFGQCKQISLTIEDGTIGGEFLVAAAVFRHGINALSCDVDGNVRFESRRDCRTVIGAAEGPDDRRYSVRFSAATIGGNFLFASAAFEAGLSLENSRVNGDVAGNSNWVSENVLLTEKSQRTSERRTYVGPGRWTKGERASLLLNGVKVTGDLDCRGAFLDQGVLLEAAEVDGSLMFGGIDRTDVISETQADGPRQFERYMTTYVGEALNSDGHSYSISAAATDIGGDVNLRGAKMIFGIRFSNAHIRGHLIAEAFVPRKMRHAEALLLGVGTAGGNDLGSATINRMSLLAPNIRIDGNVYLSGLTAFSGINLPNAVIGGNIYTNPIRQREGHETAVIAKTQLFPMIRADRLCFVRMPYATVGGDADLAGISYLVDERQIDLSAADSVLTHAVRLLDLDRAEVSGPLTISDLLSQSASVRRWWDQVTLSGLKFGDRFRQLKVRKTPLVRLRGISSETLRVRQDWTEIRRMLHFRFSSREPAAMESKRRAFASAIAVTLIWLVLACVPVMLSAAVVLWSWKENADHRSALVGVALTLSVFAIVIVSFRLLRNLLLRSSSVVAFDCDGLAPGHIEIIWDDQGRNERGADVALFRFLRRPIHFQLNHGPLHPWLNSISIGIIALVVVLIQAVKPIETLTNSSATIGLGLFVMVAAIVSVRAVRRSAVPDAEGARSFLARCLEGEHIYQAYEDSLRSSGRHAEADDVSLHFHARQLQTGPIRLAHFWQAILHVLSGHGVRLQPLLGLTAILILSGVLAFSQKGAVKGAEPPKQYVTSSATDVGLFFGLPNLWTKAKSLEPVTISEVPSPQQTTQLQPADALTTTIAYLFPFKVGLNPDVRLSSSQINFADERLFTSPYLRRILGVTPGQPVKCGLTYQQFATILSAAGWIIVPLLVASLLKSVPRMQRRRSRGD